jgi:hypothetical protein
MPAALLAPVLAGTAGAAVFTVVVDDDGDNVAGFVRRRLA